MAASSVVVLARTAGRYRAGGPGEYPQGIRDYLVAVFGYGFRVEAYAGLLTDTYPPFRLTA